MPYFFFSLFCYLEYFNFRLVRFLFIIYSCDVIFHQRSFTYSEGSCSFTVIVVETLTDCHSLFLFVVSHCRFSLVAPSFTLMFSSPLFLDYLSLVLSLLFLSLSNACSLVPHYHVHLCLTTPQSPFSPRPQPNVTLPFLFHNHGSQPSLSLLPSFLIPSLSPHWSRLFPPSQKLYFCFACGTLKS